MESTRTTIAAVGDIHFNSGPNGRLAETERVCRWVVEAAVDRGAKAMIFTGDLFDHLRSNATERNTAVRVVRYAAAFFPVLILRGNHDGLGELDFLRHLSTEHEIVVVDELAVRQVGPVTVACAPWPCKASLLASSTATNAKSADKVLLDAFRAEMDRFRARLAPCLGPKLLAAHAMVRGATTSAGQPLVACDLEVGLEDLARAGAPITLLGHIHKAQGWPSAGLEGRQYRFDPTGIDGDVLYTGSPRPTDFGDLDEKSFLLVHFDKTDSGEVRPVGWERVPTTATPLMVAGARWDGAELSLTDSLADYSGAEVQLRYSFPSKDAARVAPKAAALRASLESSGAKRVHLAPTKIATVEARAPRVAQARSLDGKLRAFWSLRGAPPNAERKLGRLHDLSIAQSVPTPRPGWMRLRKLRAVGMRPFNEPVEIDLDQIPGSVIAVTGEPGAGKSTLIEGFATVFPGRVFRTHGKAKDVLFGEDAALEVTFDCAAGNDLTVKQWFGRDLKRTSKVQVLTAAGSPLKGQDGRDRLPACGAEEYDAWAKENLPHAGVFFASKFLDQDRQDWLYLDAAPRKGVLLRVAGVEYLEQVAELCRKAEGAARKKLTMLSGQCDELRRSLGLPELYGDPKTAPTGTALYQTGEERLAAANAAVVQAGADVFRAEGILEAACAGARLRGQRSDMETTLTKERGDLQAVLDRINQQHALVQAQREIDDAVLEKQRAGLELEGIDAALSILLKEEAEVDRQIAEVTVEGHALAKERVAENERRRLREVAIERRRGEILAEVGRHSRALAEHREALVDSDKIRSAAASIAGLEERVRQAREEELRLLERKDGAAAFEDSLRDDMDAENKRATMAKSDLAQIAEWPGKLDAFLSAKAMLAAEIAAAAAKKLAIEAALNEAQRGQEARATALRETVDKIAWEDDYEGGRSRALRAAAADDQALSRIAAAVGQVDALKDEVASVEARLLDLHTSKASLRRPDWLPETSEEVAAALAAAQLHEQETGALVAAATEAHRQAWADLSTCQEAVNAAERHLNTLHVELQAARILAERERWLCSAEGRVAELTAEIDKLFAEQQALSEESQLLHSLDASPRERQVASFKAMLSAARGELSAQRANASRMRAAVLREIAAAEHTLARRSEVAAAAALLSELEQQRAALEQQVAAHQAELDMIPLPLPTLPSVVDAQAALDAARGSLATAQERLSVVLSSLASLREREAEREVVLSEAEDWEDMAYSFGRNGIQADEVDAIGPRVAELATEILHDCYGVGWTVTEIDTVGACDAMVAVAEEVGDARSDRTFSPGQRAILAGAMAMAITAVENDGHEPSHLFFDEPGGPLSDTAHLVWARMIRKVVERTGGKAIFISHNTGAVQQADARIVVANGRVEVQ